MATISFIHQSKAKAEAQIYCRVSVSKELNFKKRTGLTCSEDELKNINATKTSIKNASTKQLRNKLTDLKLYLFDCLNEAQMQGLELNGNWLGERIDLFFNRAKPTEEEEIKSDLLLDYFDVFIKTLGSRLVRGGGIGVSEATRKKYVSTRNKIEEFQVKTNKTYKLSQIDENFRTAFNEYLKEKDRLAVNTIGKYIKIVKTVTLDAQSNGYEVSPLINKVKGQSEEGSKVYLNFEELEKLKAVELEDELLDRTRDWLIIGCYVGQRVSDLLRMNKSMIEKRNNYEFISIKQVKTGKQVLIPIHSEVKRILDKRKGEFPESFGETTGSASALFNRYLKEVCLKAKIDTIEEGKIFNSECKRNESGKFKKWQLITSHVCRRSFATNFYATELYPTPLLMNITAHGSEAMFLKYIGKKPLDYSLKLAEIWSNKP